MLITTPGTIRNLYVKLDVAPGAGTSRVFTVRKNGADQALTCTISGAGTTQCNDTTNSFAVVAGDRICVECVPVGSGGEPATPPAASKVRCSVVFEADTDGYYNMPVSSDQQLSTFAADRFCPVWSGDVTHTNIEVGHRGLAYVGARTVSFEAMYIRLSGTPGAGNRYDFTLRKDGASTGLTVQIAGAATTGNAALSIAIANGNDFNYLLEATSFPTARYWQGSLLVVTDLEAHTAILDGFRTTVKY
jgi:hypothetical protein